MQKDLYDLFYHPGRTEKKINLSSLVTKISFKDFSILLPGDIYKKGEKQLIKLYGSELQSTILKASHHGEWYTANYPEFVKMVKPDYGIIQDNRYITAVISNVYKKAGSRILYRLSSGYILIETDGKKYSITEHSF
jgi:competence protein ComEC